MIAINDTTLVILYFLPYPKLGSGGTFPVPVLLQRANRAKDDKLVCG